MAVSRNKQPAESLRDRVGALLAARRAPDERLCVGLSGGCDSVVLLHLLSHLGLDGRLQALHVHHGLSPNADAWAAFCADYCARLSVPLQIVPVSVASHSRLGLEAAARAARYAAFAACPAELLVLAHHRGDQAETLLFNLVRGCGVLGAAGMPLERPLAAQRLWRPLLGCTRAALEAYAEAHQLSWIDDESNGDTRYARNFLRHEIMPRLRQRFPGTESSLAQAAAHFGEADELLAELALADWNRACADGEGSPRLVELRPLSLPRLKNLLRYRLRIMGWRMPAGARLDEFARQLLVAGPDRHPELKLPDGEMRVVGGRLHWLAQN